MTGAAGTVGNYVVGLLEAAGLEVVANDVRPSGLRKPARGRLAPGDLCDPGVRADALEGVQGVVHTAGLLDASADPRQLGKVNGELVEHLYEDAAARGVERFVHLSTCMLYQPRLGRAADEDAPLSPRGPHGLSKQSAEAFLRGTGKGGGPAWTILRAAPVYGRRGRHFAASLLAVGPIVGLVSPRLVRPSGGPLHHTLHAEDLARALLFVLRDERTAYGTFNVADDEPLPLGERLAITFDAYGLSTFGKLELPRWLLELGDRTFHAPGAFEAADALALWAWNAVILRHRLKSALRPRLDREAVTLLDDDLRIDSSRLRALGWSPRFGDFRRGFSDVLRWYQAEGWVPRYA